MNDFTQPELPALFSASSEEWVIGAILIDGAAIDRVVDALQARHFFLAGLAEIYGAMVALNAANRPIDPVTVAEALDKRGQLIEIGGLERLTKLSWAVASSSNIKRHAEIIIEKAMMRGGIQAASTLIERLQSGDWDETPAEVLHEIASAMEELAEGDEGASDALTAGQVAQAAIRDIDARLAGEKGVKTGLLDLDRKVAIRNGDLVIIAGRPGMGKTVLAMNIAESIAQEGAVAIFSMEMGREQLGMRQIASLGGVSLTVQMEPAELTDEDYDRMSVAVAAIDSLRMEIDFRPAMTIAQMRARCRKLRRKHQGLALIVVDYLQLMTHPGTENRVNEITKISGGLKALAKEMGCPVLALSQLSRKVEERADKHPQMADLRESGSIEQDADVVLFAYRDDYYNPDSPHKGIAEIGVAKQRMGVTGAWIPVAFEGEFSRFRNLARDFVMPPLHVAARKRGFD